MLLLTFLVVLGCGLSISVQGQGLGSFQYIVNDINQRDYESAALEIERLSANQNNPSFTFIQGYLNRKQRAYPQAENLLQRSLEEALRKKPNNDTLISKIHYELAFIAWARGAYEEAHSHVTTCINFQKNYLSPKAMEMGRCYDFLGLIQSNTGHHADALTSFQLAIDIYDQDSTSVGTTKKAKSYRKKGNCHFRMGEFYTALKSYQEALAIWQSLGNATKELATEYTSIANVYDEWQDYEQALAYHKLAINTCKSSPQCNKLALYLINLGVTQGHLLAHQDALQSYKQALELIQADPGQLVISTKDLATLYHDLGSLYQQLGNAQEALFYFQQALDLRLKLWGEIHPRIAATYLSLGQYYMQEGQLQLAETYLLKARDSRFEGVNIFHPEVADNYLALSLLYHKLGDWDKAMLYAQNTLIAVGNDFYEDNKEINPTGEALRTPFQERMLKALKMKGELWFHKGEALQDKKMLRHALDAYHIAIDLVDSIRMELQASSSRRHWQAHVFSLYEAAIETAFLLYEAEGDSTYIRDVFALSEKSKSILLLIQLQAIHTTQRLGVDQDWLDKERALRNEVRYHESLLFKAKKDKKARKAEDESARAHAQIAYRHFMREFEETHPAFSKSKYQNKGVTWEEVRQELLHEQDQLLVEFFAGDSALYVISIGKENQGVRRISSAQRLYQQVDSFTILCKQAGFSGANEAEAFFAMSREIFEQLLGPELAAQKPQGLLLIPDGNLMALPFDILIPGGSSKASTPPDYLLQAVSIRYAHAASILLADQQHISKRYDRLLGIFAPNFELINQQAKSDSLSTFWPPLSYNSSEAANLQKMFKGDMFIEKQATKGLFLKEAPHYQLLHISTHAASDKASATYLVMADSLLSMSELFQIELNADLVVLSACETGTGRYVRGEGVMSLSRAFAYAGCPNSLISLWPVDDGSTAKMMGRFYHHIQAGLRRDEALRQAKLDFLSSANIQQQHPFYWAGFQLWGTGEVVEINKDWRWLWIIGGLLIGFWGGRIWWLKSGKSRNS